MKSGIKKIKEVPITFRDRIYGKSKLGKGVIWEYFRHVVGLYGYKIRRKIRERC